MMFKNYFRVALRNLQRNRIYTAINVVGLALGLSCSICIFILLNHEFSYDLHHPNVNHLYRVTSEIVSQNESTQLSTTPPPVALQMARDFPEVMQATRFLRAPGAQNYIFIQEDESFMEEGGVYVDSTFFEMFGYDFLYGDPSLVMNEPNSLVISAALSNKLFGKANSLNETIKIQDNGGEYTFRVTGILEDKQPPSFLEGAKFFFSLNSNTPIARFVYTNQSWLGNNFLHSFVSLNPQTNVKDLEAKFPAFLEKYGRKQFEDAGSKKIHHLQAVSDIHLYSKQDGDIGGNSNAYYISILTGIGLLILLVACINFMNLATAQASKRAKEVGLRKVLGAYRSQLIQQFFGESAILTLISLIFALALVEFFLPIFNQILNRELSVNLFSDYKLWLGLLGISTFTALVAGSYPALYLASFSPIEVFRKKIKAQFSGISFRKALVVFQFTIFIALITGAVLILQQLNFINNKDLGFQRSQIMILDLQTTELQSKYPLFKEKISQLAAVENISGTTTYPSQFIYYDDNFYKKGTPKENSVNCKLNYMDYEFIPTMGFDLITGRNFNPRLQSDSNKVILNEIALKRFGWAPEEAIGQKILRQWQEKEFEIIGIVKDFHFASLHNTIAPLMFMCAGSEENYPHVAFSFRTKDTQSLIQEVSTIWDGLSPNVPLMYSFLDNQLHQMYDFDQRFAKVINFFTGLIIFIACLGLFGLASFTLNQRRKEIGIRKVLGASIPSLLRLLSRDFVMLVLIAFLLAVPITYYLLDNWLQDFAYHIEVFNYLHIFLLSGVLALGIALLTISSQAWRAAKVNPVDILKDE